MCSSFDSNYWIFFLFFIFLAALGLRCFARAFSSCSERGLLFVAMYEVGFIEGGFSCCRAQALGMQASAAAAHGLSRCRSWALEHGPCSYGTWA